MNIDPEDLAKIMLGDDGMLSVATLKRYIYDQIKDIIKKYEGDDDACKEILLYTKSPEFDYYFERPMLVRKRMSGEIE